MSIIDAFNYYFEIIPANTDELKQEVYKLRYQVYCVEKNFENPETHIDGMEYDDYDANSHHYLIRHRETNRYTATTRLIVPDSSDPQKLFPIEVHSQIDEIPLIKSIHRTQLAELSRFCVSKHFRRRANEQNLIITNDTDASRAISKKNNQYSPNLTLALFACAVRISAEHNINYWYAIMEPALKRVFSALGIHFTEIGPLVDYHGLRVPCVIKVDELLSSVAGKDLDYWDMLTDRGQYIPIAFQDIISLSSYRA